MLQQHKLIRGNVIAKRIRNQVKQQVEGLASCGWRPKLLSVVFSLESESQRSAIEWYVANQRRVAESCGIMFEEMQFPRNISNDAFIDALSQANQDPRVTGILMQRPFPSHLRPDDIQMTVHPLKDVEGMHPSSIGKVVYNESEMVPCTAKAAVECLKSTSLATGPNRSIKDLTCVVVGHSEIVGKPISFLLMNEQAVVTTCHHMTKDLRFHTRKADAVFVAAGKPDLIQGDMLKPGAAVIDIGINPIQNPATGEETIVGDSNIESCLPVVGWITPVPGGVGPVTTAVLMENTVLAARAQKKMYESIYGPQCRVNNNYMMS